MQGLQPSEKETSELRDHVIIAGFGRVGQIIAQLLSERLIPFVALDVSAERVQVSLFLDQQLLNLASETLRCQEVYICIVLRMPNLDIFMALCATLVWCCEFAHLSVHDLDITF